METEITHASDGTPRLKVIEHPALPYTKDTVDVHDRNDCSDVNPINAEAVGSNGCQRCTQIMMDQRDALLNMLDRVVHNPDRHNLNAAADLVIVCKGGK